MEFRLLGPLSVVDDGRELDIGAPKQRALLALLLLHRNESVASERLVDWLWTGRPPATAQKSLQVYVSGLRKALGADRVETHGRAYLLRVMPGELDLDQFDSLVQSAHDASPAGAATLLRNALDLYRGEPLVELRYDEVARAEIARLEELRLHTLEERIDADLALGRHNALVPELEGLIASHPLRERLRYQQMLALYRSGRQADALDAYRRAQRVLDEDLGLEPGPELRRLQRQILDQDPDLAAHTTTPGLVRIPARQRRRMAYVLAGGTVLVAAAVAGGVVASTGGSGGLKSVSANSVGVIDPGNNRLVAQIRVGAAPTAVAVDGPNVWVANAGDRTLSRVDAKTRHVVAVTSLGKTPSSIAARHGTVWLANAIGADGTVSRVTRPARGTSKIVSFTTRTGYADLFATAAPTAIAVDASSVWANSNPRGLLVRLHPSSGRIDSFLLGPQRSVDGIAVGEGAVWITSSADDTVLRFDPATHRIRPIAVAGAGQPHAGPDGIAIGDGAVWVTDALADTVSRIDPRTNTVTQTISVGARPTAIAATRNAVWVLNRGDGSVWRIDPKRNVVTARIDVGPHVTGLAAGTRAVWVTVAGGSSPALSPPRTRVAPPLPASSCSPVFAGSGRPRFLIASDLPRIRGGQPSLDIVQMQEGIRLVLEQHGYHAGSYSVGYQACDDSTGGQIGDWNPTRCAANARAYAANPNLLAVIGAYNSACTGIELPITNASPTGPLATISPDNTAPGLTARGPGTALLEPDVYYPTGLHSFARVVGNDQAQGAADALLAAQLGLSHIYLLSDPTGIAVADAVYTARAANRLGLDVVGRAAWNPRTHRYDSLVRRVAAARPDGIYLSGWEAAGGLMLYRKLRAALGPHVTFFASDNWGFPGPGDPWTPGLYESIAGPPLSQLNTTGRRFLEDFRARYHHSALSTDVVAAAQSAEIVLDAIGRSDGTRASVTRQLLADQVFNGPLGTFRFDSSGDPTRSPFSIYRFPTTAARPRPPASTLQDAGARLFRVIVAPPALAQP